MLFLFFGENSYGIKKTIEKMAQSQKILIFDPDEEGYLQHLRQTNLFGENPFLVFRDFLAKGKKDQLDIIHQQLLAFPFSDPERSVAFWEQQQPDRRKKIVLWLIKNVQVQEFKSFSSTQTKKWLEEKFNEKSKIKPVIDKLAIEKLVELHGNNLWVLESELRKLLLYTGGRQITVREVERLCSSTYEESIFSFLDVLAERRLSQAAKTFAHLIEKRQDLSPLFLMTVRQFRLLILVKKLLQKGIAFGRICASLQQPTFVVKKLLTQSKFYSWPELKNIYQKLMEIDLGNKSGRTDLETEMLLFICALG